MSTSDGSTKPLDVQIGGDHYKSMAIQPMEYSMANKLDACQHTIIKYVTRFREKGGVQDLEKAKHCIDLLIHFERQAATVKESLTVHPVHPATFDHIDPADVEPASAIDDSSERMQAIGQNGNDGEHYDHGRIPSFTNCKIKSRTSPTEHFARLDNDGRYWSSRGKIFNMKHWQFLRWIK